MRKDEVLARMDIRVLNEQRLGVAARTTERRIQADIDSDEVLAAAGRVLNTVSFCGSSRGAAAR
ncbi:hypothetical protein ACQFN5_21675 [Klebsiella sp. WOUb02]|uniref:hypothetical protein n=1 Tax=Klebsiella sp. WOUb02 TaxID=3161071 RepID=UPI003CF91057